jgi:hypothetical protein
MQPRYDFVTARDRPAPGNTVLLIKLSHVLWLARLARL